MQIRPRRLSVPVSLGCALSLVAASSVQAAEEIRESVLYETATVVARPLASSTASVTIFTREEIEDLDAVSVADVIRHLPGLDVVSTGSRSGLDVAQVRGGEPNFTVVLLDGVPLNDATDQLRGGAVNLNSLPVDSVERIEVVRGPLSSFFGSEALGGALNIITRRGASDAPAYGFDVAAGDASVLRGATSLSAGNDDRDYFVGVSWEQEQERIEDDEFDRLSINGNYRIDIGGSSELRFTGRVTTWEADDYPDFGGPEPPTPAGSDPVETRHSEHDEYNLGVELRFGSKERRQRVYVTGYRHELERETPETVTPVLRVPASIEDTEFTNLRGGWTLPVLAGGKNRLNVGLEVDWERGSNDSTLFDVAPIFFPGLDLDGSYSISRTTGSAFVEYTAEVGAMMFEVGARVDDAEEFDAELSPRIGLSYLLPNESTRLRLSAGRGFKLPSFFVLASPPDLGGNPDLDPETTIGGDLSVEHRFEASDLTASLGVFIYRYEDLIDFIFPGGKPMAVNLSEVDAQGAELGIGWSPTERLAVEANATYQDVENRDTDETLRDRPEWIGGLRLNWRVTDRLRWTLDGQWVSESLEPAIVDPPRDSTAGYQLYGTALFFDLVAGWELHARVDNLADKEYGTLIGFPGPDRGFRIGLRHRSR